MRRQAVFATLTLSLFLTGCQTLPVPTTSSESWEVRRATLQGREHFQLKGRVAVAAGQEGFTASLHWIQDGNESQVSLDGPLGVGGVRVTSNAASLSIINSRGERLDSEAARAELKGRLGFDAPLASLRYWLLSVPDPSGVATEVVDANRRLTALEQNGWQIDYADYVAVQGEWLPGRITLRTADVRVRLIVDHWDS
jgi:outer membrane lipoprotein LolB